jgi:hypothetical protein
MAAIFWHEWRIIAIAIATARLPATTLPWVAGYKRATMMKQDFGHVEVSVDINQT